MKSYFTFLTIIMNIGGGILSSDIRQDCQDLLDQIKYNLLHILKETVGYVDQSVPANLTTERLTTIHQSRPGEPSVKYPAPETPQPLESSSTDPPHQSSGGLNKEAEEKGKTDSRGTNSSEEERCQPELQHFRSSIYTSAKAMAYIECAIDSMIVRLEPASEDQEDVRTLETILEILYPLIDMMNMEDKETREMLQQWTTNMYRKANQLAQKLDQDPEQHQDQHLVPFILILVSWTMITFALIVVGFLVAWRSLRSRRTEESSEDGDAEYLETRLARNLLNRFSDRGSRFKRKSIHAESARTQEPRSTHYQSFRSFGQGRNSYATPRCELGDVEENQLNPSSSLDDEQRESSIWQTTEMYSF